MLQKFTIDGRLPGYNELHSTSWQKNMRIKAEAMDRVKVAALPIKPITTRSVFIITCFEPNAKRDMDNVMSGAAKVILDALQDADKLPNDSRRWVRLNLPPVEVDRDNPRIEVEIYEQA